MNKRILSVIVLYLYLISHSFSVLASDFSDLSGHWAENAINTWSQKGVINGYDGKFNPDENLTRAELATILSNLLGLNNKSENLYGDISGDEWYADAILKCTAASIMNGDGVNANPAQSITREAAMVMLARALKIEGSYNIQRQFLDYTNISSWAKNQVYAMINAGYVNGVGNSTLAPQNNVTRAEIVKILDNAIKMYINWEGEYVIGDDISGIVVLKGNNIRLITKNAALKVVISDEYSYTLSESKEVTGSVVFGSEHNSGGDESAVAYTVTFFDKEGSVYDVQKVAAGENAKPSGNPIKSGFLFDGWDDNFTNVTYERSVTAKWIDTSEFDNLFAMPAIYTKAVDTFTVPVKLCGKVNLSAFDLEIIYDVGMLEFQEYKNEDDDVILNHDSKTGIIHMNFVSNLNISGEIDLCDLLFKTVGRISDKTKIAIAVKEVIQLDEGGNITKAQFNTLDSKVNIY